jgi:hypothetical protein
MKRIVKVALLLFVAPLVPRLTGAQTQNPSSTQSPAQPIAAPQFLSGSILPEIIADYQNFVRNESNPGLSRGGPGGTMSGSRLPSPATRLSTSSHYNGYSLIDCVRDARRSKVQSIAILDLNRIGGDSRCVLRRASVS